MLTITIDKALDRLGLSARQLAIESKLRPNTISELKHNRAKQVNFETLDKILNTLNTISDKRELNIRFDLSDIIEYEYK